MAKRITARQRDALVAIAAFVREHGYPPSTRELGAALGVSGQAALQLLLHLEVAGKISRAPGVARGVRIINRSRREGVGA